MEDSIRSRSRSRVALCAEENPSMKKTEDHRTYVRGEEGKFRWERSLINIPLWNKKLLISYVIAVSLDPLFFYIPIIDENNKCLGMDKAVRTAALVTRSLTDFTFLVHFLYISYEAIRSEIPYTYYHQHSKSAVLRDPIAFAKKQIARKLSWSSAFYFLLDLFAFLPIPQVLIVYIFYKMGGSGYLEHRKILNLFLLAQYVPRVFRIHLLSNEVTHSSRVLVKGVFNVFLYILASHVLGAFWYFFSIQRETSCWRQACVKYSANPKECMSTFYCEYGRITSSKTMALLNKHCPLNTPDGTVAPFDFGIFLDALKNHNTEHVNFAKKFFYSFWWGLRNLSNYGTNLTTSTYIWENFFAVLISIIGLLLFTYLIGNVQLFMQMENKKSEEKNLKIKMKVLDVRRWMSRNGLPRQLEKEIMNNIKGKLDENKDIDLLNIFSILPSQTRKDLKRCLCRSTLTKVPKLKEMDARVLTMMCDYYLKPVMFKENSFVFRMGDPLDCVLFVTQGTMWSFEGGKEDEGSPDSSASTLPRPIRRGEYYGEELILSWASPTYNPKLPVLKQHVRSETKVEAFALMANDLATLVSKFRLQWGFIHSSQEVKEDMARTTIAAAFRRIRNTQWATARPRPATYYLQKL